MYTRLNSYLRLFPCSYFRAGGPKETLSRNRANEEPWGRVQIRVPVFSSQANLKVQGLEFKGKSRASGSTRFCEEN